MFKRPKTFLFAFFMLLILGGRAPAKITETAILNIYNQLKDIKFDASRVVTVDSFMLKKDRGAILFKQGKLYFSQPVLGKVTHAVFIGDGLFTLNPPNEIEKYQVQRFLKADSIHQEFSAAYLQFTDDTFGHLSQNQIFRQEPVPAQVYGISKKLNDLFLEEQGVNLPIHALTDILNKTDGHFISIFEVADRVLNFPNYLVFSFDAASHEAVGVHQFFPHRTGKDFHTICSFPKTEFAPTDAPIRASRFTATHYDLEVDVKKNGEISARADITVAVTADSLRLLFFEIFAEMEIDSVKNGQAKLTFLKEKKESGISVFLTNPVSRNSTQITVFFKGKVLEQIQNKYTLKNQLFWYPRKGYLQPATYKLTFTYPKDMQVVATGEKTGEWEIDGKKKSGWQESIPSIAAAFIFGRFQSDTFKFSDSGEVIVFSEKNRSKRVRESVAGDVASSLYFFERYLGQLPFSRITVAESASSASYGYRRTLLLTDISFEHEIEGIMQALRGHETSHQWWGNVIGWKTYHDQWLSESLAEYSGALINQFLLKDDKYFWDLVDGWRNDFLYRGHIGVSLGMRRFGFSRTDLANSEGADAGPIWLGQRLGSKNPVDYYLNVYEKGALVIHMLRTMLHDFETNSDERFLNMLTDFVQTYSGQKVETRDFQKTVSKHFGQNMDWFFQQWVYGNKIPTYEYSYKILQKQNEYFVALEIQQKKVPPEFRAHIPIGIKFDPGEKKIHLIPMASNSGTFNLGPFTQTPKEIIFNDTFGVLAYIKKK